ncbi:MAG: recombinase family protein [Clostridia bacterium]|nr:recombinase family protein [Clostridia bacterium]
MGNTYFYHRVSSKGQKEDRGLIEAQEFCEKNGIKLAGTYVDKITGKTFDRPRYTVLKEDVLRDDNDDVLLITEIDRLGRTKSQILEELREYKLRKIRVMVLELPTTLVQLDGGDSLLNKLILETIQDLIIQIYSCLSEAEVEKKTLRQRQGIEAMKLRGDWDKYGRPKKAEWNDFVAVYERVLKKEIMAVEAAKEIKVSMPTFYRYKKKYDTEKGLLKNGKENIENLACTS